MMTISYIFENTDGPISDMTSGVAGIPLDSGAGHLKSNKAMDPGLLHDIEVNDYNNFVHALNYTREQLKFITRRSSFSATKALSTINVTIEPATTQFTIKYCRVKFNMAVEIDPSQNPWNDRFGNSGYLSWHEVSGKHVVTCPIVSAYASETIKHSEMLSVGSSIRIRQ
ncbi:hypothetical protein RJ639_005568 [Escallonia herrerae]|uniref:Subtilisin-like protease fibronectin type-III domain-containing protein n=1 Tax=Escallonia herrerae TaxID=1293975 RepID=A0AA89AUR5_9ASTE|nr:hypothetical protein RJ639_005568 [Escallonia herrerae]